MSTHPRTGDALSGTPSVTLHRRCVHCANRSLRMNLPVGGPSGRLPYQWNATVALHARKLGGLTVDPQAQGPEPGGARESGPQRHFTGPRRGTGRTAHHRAPCSSRKNPGHDKVPCGSIVLPHVETSPRSPLLDTYRCPDNSEDRKARTACCTEETIHDNDACARTCRPFLLVSLLAEAVGHLHIWTPGQGAREEELDTLEDAFPVQGNRRAAASRVPQPLFLRPRHHCHSTVLANHKSNSHVGLRPQPWVLISQTTAVSSHQTQAARDTVARTTKATHARPMGSTGIGLLHTPPHCYRTDASIQDHRLTGQGPFSQGMTLLPCPHTSNWGMSLSPARWESLHC